MTPRLSLQVRRYRVPFVSPWLYGSTTIREREGRLVRIHDRETGRTGWGEAVPLPGFGVEDLDAIDAVLSGATAAAWSGAPASLSRELDTARWARWPASRCALVTALMDATCEQMLARELAAGAVTTVRSQLAAGAAVNEARRVDGAWQTVKLKVGVHVDPAAEADALRRWLELNPDHSFRLDANGQWTADRVRTFCSALGDDIGRIEMLEQPTPAGQLDELLGVQQWCPIPVWADESVYQAQWHRLAGGVAGVVVKPMVCGGPDRAIEKVRELGVAAMTTTSLESVVGRTMCAHVAAALDAHTPGVHGLATGDWLAGDVVRNVPLPDAPQWVLTDAAGLGPFDIGGPFVDP